MTEILIVRESKQKETKKGQHDRDPKNFSSKPRATEDVSHLK